MVTSRQQFLDAMSCVAYSVCVVTTDGEAGRDGMTVTAMSPVSADGPHPTLLICLRTGSRAAPILLRNQVFCVNLLKDDQTDMAERFAGRERTDKDQWFDGTDWTTLHTGAPSLSSALASLDCRVLSTSAMGDHQVVFGNVLAVRSGDGTPLLHSRRAYQRLPGTRGSAPPSSPLTGDKR